MEKPYPAGLMWFRRDLRVHDNAALHHALKSCGQLHCVFVFDSDILGALPREDRRVEFIRESLVQLDESLRARSGQSESGLIVLHGAARTEVPHLAQALGVQAVFANHDDEPQALARDRDVQGTLAHAGVAFHGFKDHVVFERRELLTQAGKPYCVFTPYKNAWLAKVDACKFDPQGRFILRYLPHLEGLPAQALHAPWTASPLDLAAAGIVLGRDDPLPVVDHEQARQLALQRYAVVRKGSD